MPSTVATASTKTLMSAGARYYGALTLPLYDWAVLKTVVPYAWQCPLSKEQELYHTSVGPRHLDVGVASGYFLRHTQWPTNHDNGKGLPKEIVLMDLNPNSTKYAADRLRRMEYPVSEVVGDALDLKSYPKVTDHGFDSVGMFHLLHCIPGDLKQKKVVLENAGKVIHPDGVVFGANVTPFVNDDDDSTWEPNLFAKAVLAVSHTTGALNNQKDSHKDMEMILDDIFHDYKLERVGGMSLWEGRNPKSS